MAALHIDAAHVSVCPFVYRQNAYAKHDFRKN